MKHLRFAGALVLFAVLAGLASPTTAVAADDGDWISATSALVNRLGGVSLVGQASCAGSYAALVAGDLQYVDEYDQWSTIPYEAGDDVIMLANADEYTVSQPAGRKAMIQVSHGSSILSPCFATTSLFPDGTVLPDRVACDEAGAPCRWVTTAYGYDHDAFGPYFDYSPNGKFKAGLMAVRVKPLGLVAVVIHDGSDTWYGSPYAFDVLFNATVTAVNYR